MNKQHEIELWFAQKIQNLEVNSQVPIFARKKILINLQKNLEYFYNYSQILTKKDDQNQLENQLESEVKKAKLVLGQSQIIPSNSSLDQISFQSFDSKKNISKIKQESKETNIKIKNDKNDYKSQETQIELIQKNPEIDSKISNQIPKSIDKNNQELSQSQIIEPNLETDLSIPTNQKNQKFQTIISFEHFPKKVVLEPNLIENINQKNIPNLPKLSVKLPVKIEENIVNEKVKTKVEKTQNLVIQKPEKSTEKSKITNKIEQNIKQNEQIFEPKLELAKDFDLITKNKHNKNSQGLDQIKTQDFATIISFDHLPSRPKNPNQQNPKITKNTETEPHSPINSSENNLEINKRADLMPNLPNNSKIIIPMIGKNQIQSSNFGKKIQNPSQNLKINQVLNKKLQNLFQKAG